MVPRGKKVGTQKHEFAKNDNDNFEVIIIMTSGPRTYDLGPEDI